MERVKIEAHPSIAEFYRGVPGWRVKQAQTGKMGWERSWDPHTRKTDNLPDPTSNQTCGYPCFLSP